MTWPSSNLNPFENSLKTSFQSFLHDIGECSILTMVSYTLGRIPRLLKLFVSIFIGATIFIYGIKYVKRYPKIWKTDIHSSLYQIHPTDVLLFNRVPKCGGTTLLTLLRQLSHLNNFTHVSSNIYDKKQLSSSEQRVLFEQLVSYKKEHRQMSFDRHVYFTDFNRFQLNSHGIHLKYINIVRDPIERLISSFYYRREVARRLKSNASDNWLNKVSLYTIQIQV